MRRHLLIASVIALTMGLQTVASGTGSGDVEPILVGGGGGDGVVTDHDLMNITFFGLVDGLWVIAGDDVVIPVERVDEAGKWVKMLHGSRGHSKLRGADENSHTPLEASQGDKFVILELLRRVSGDETWTDWHEEIRTPGWVWDEFEFDIPFSDNEFVLPTMFVTDGPPINPFDVLTSEAPGLERTVGEIDGSKLEFDFDPVEPGQYVTILKLLRYEGVATTGASSDSDFSGVVEIAQYPTPEPLTATLGLIGIGALMIANAPAAR